MGVGDRGEEFLIYKDGQKDHSEHPIFTLLNGPEEQEGEEKNVLQLNCDIRP